MGTQKETPGGEPGADTTQKKCNQVIHQSGPKVNPENIPEALKDRPAWVAWRSEDRDGRPTKVPYCAAYRKRADATDASTWSSFGDTLHHVNSDGRFFAGLGFVLGDGFAGVDIDDCIDADGTLHPGAVEVVAALNSYTEVSPSGRGLKVFLRADLGDADGHRTAKTPWGGDIEVYWRDRYFTVTGQHWPGTPQTVEDRQAALTDLHARFLCHADTPSPVSTPAPIPPTADVADLLEVAFHAANGAKIRALFEERGRDGGSEGDAALCALLAFYSGGDAGLLERLMRASNRMRAKWDTRRGGETWIGAECRKAVERHSGDWYTPGRPAVTAASTEKGTTTATTPEAAAWNLTDVGNGQRLVARHGRDLRYCATLRTWFVWTGQRWRPDCENAVRELGKEVARSILAEASLVAEDDLRKAVVKHAFATERDRSLKAMLWCAETEPGIPVAQEDLDADPWALNCLNGTLDLRTGELRPHRREDLLTHLCPVAYDPDAHSDLWQTFLERVTGGDKGLQAFLEQVAGYALTGSTREEKLLFVYGPARSGKSTFLGALQATLGEDYSHTCDFEAFLKRKPTGGPKDDLANLAGKRLVVSVETDEGARLAEGLVKQLTGGDRIRARRLYSNSVEFLPQFKLFLAANDRPKARDDDDALWERILEVPFPFGIPKADRDPAVKEKLCDPAQSGAAILAWAVRGCLSWQREGLQVPAVVEASTAAYRDSMNPLSDFIAECCLVEPDAWCASADLLETYRQWAQEQGLRHTLTGKQVGEKLRAMGCQDTRQGQPQKRGWRGIGLLER